MIIPFDLKTVATTTDGEQGIISTVYVDVIQILTSPQEALADTEMQGTITMIAECGGFGGDGVDEFLSDVLKELQDWGFVQEVEDDHGNYWVLTPLGLLLKAEL
ncbi:unknown protein (plasmid) [Nostoc sp. NIES-3756]|uniref:hypothetical protein n=1 Tax=Nostoc sp. NIES-3756 TaxID=1751286 RepID=UPI00072211B2|nr:hypothetical protein [Nostoc sp. NIES-3756]BAT56693.1 unknown protein [Nostoc sp. NIES-3756]